jgi:hypothetical protein
MYATRRWLGIMLKFPLLLLCFLLLICSCAKKEETITSCTSFAITAVATASDPCQPQGIITVTSPTGSGFEYRAGNVNWQSSPQLISFVAGEYNLTVKDSRGCTSTITITVAAKAAGSLFGQVKSLLAVNCISCHSGPNPQAGLDWTDNCTIVKNWSRIKARAIDGNPSPMPQGGLLPLSERNKITNWIAAGHRFTD